MIKVLILLILLLLVSTSQSSNNCGYETCNLGVSNKLNVHIVPHTHDDVGWLQTVDQYYYSQVQYILDSVMVALDQNPDRRFIYVEIAFFWRWWNEQNDEMKDKVRSFVNSGRLEFISGGWCMNDEATTHYSGIIDQHSLGAEFLRNEFGECGRPKVGWQLDPFGHSREQASLSAQMGFDGLFFARADYQDKDTRTKSKTLEMIWKASQNLNQQQSWLFTNILYHHYDAPIDYTNIRDDIHLHDYNLPDVIHAFIQAAHDQANAYRTNHIIMLFGDDFQYQNALHDFKNIDKLIKYVNTQNGSDVNVFYSTPSCYLYALNRLNQSWPTKSDDFFPYANHPHGYWTGYFTSRSAFKGYERYSNNILQVTKQLNALANTQLANSIFYLSEPMGIAQHHDAVAGTEKQAVVFDYAQRLADGIDAAQNVINEAYGKLLSKSSQKQGETTTTTTSQFLCQLSNISQCLEINGQDRFTLTLWNPTIHPVVEYVRVPVNDAYTVIDPSGQTIVVDIFDISESTKHIPGRDSNAQKQILILKANLPSLGFNTYYFQKKTQQTTRHVNITQNQSCLLTNQYLQIEIDGEGNLVKLVNLNKSVGIEFVNQGVYWYEGFPDGIKEQDHQTSGAYVFRPLNQTAQPVSTQRTITCFKGEIVQRAVIQLNDWTNEEISLYHGSTNVEIEWTIGPIPIHDNLGKEIIMRYDTDIQSQAKFYTDANGREIIERIRDYRPTWNYSINEPVSGNYYPINSRIAIKDDTRQLTVLTDRSHGGSSIHDGSIEVMLHRRLLYDDGFGVGEALNETAFNQGLVVRGRHFLVLESPSSSALQHRPLAQQIYMHPLQTFALTDKTFADYSSSYRLTWSALATSLPYNIHLLTFHQLSTHNYLIRLEHYFELNEDQIYSKTTSFDLQILFQSIGTIQTILELTLAANLPLTQLQRLNWTTTDEQFDISNQSFIKDTTVYFNPMQIRTFNITIA